jgi:predicted component of viral defense system (DUF524 family)
VQIKIKGIETVNVNHLRVRVPRGFGRSAEEPTVLVQTRSQSRGSRSAAGVMSAVAYIREREVAHSELKVLPANFSEEEYQQMLEEIGSLALSSDSWIHADISTEVSETGKGKSSDLSTKIQSLIDCVQVIEDKLPLLEASPLLELKRQDCPVPVHRISRTSKGLKAFVRNPGRRYILQPALTESLDSNEHRFLRWLVEQWLLPVMTSLCDSLKSSMEVQESLEEVRGHSSRSSTIKELLSRLTQHRKQEEKKCELERKLEQSLESLHQLRNCKLLLAASVTATEIQPSERLLGTPGYRDIYLAYRAAVEAMGGTLQQGIRIFNAIVRKEVRATWQCYELWCFVQLLRTFGELGGFCFQKGSTLFSESLVLNGQTLQLKPKTRLTLVRPNSSLEVELCYEPRMQSRRDARTGALLEGNQTTTLRPDFMVSINRNGREKVHFLLDAKYRDYEKQGEPILKRDLWTTAHLKYFEGINEANSDVQIRGSYILHSDPAARNNKNDFWGGVRPEDWLKEEHGIQEELLPKSKRCKGHHFGLIRLRPDKDCNFQLRRLLDMWLLFHVPTETLSIECPRCGEKLQIDHDIGLIPKKKDNPPDEVDFIRKVLTEQRTRSVVCVCPNCWNFWFQNHCRERHPLYKAGKRSFHTPSKYEWGKSGMYICPTCDDDPDPRKYRESYNHK